MNIESPIESLSPIPAAGNPLKEVEDLLAFGAWIWKPHSGTMEWTDGMCRLAGYAPAEALPYIPAEKFLKLLPEPERAALAAQVGQCMESGIPFSLQHTLLSTRGERLAVFTRAKRIKDAEGDYCIAGATQEMAGAAPANEEDEQHARHMEQYELHLKFGTWQYTDATGKMTWSAGMYNIFGYDPVQDSGLTINEALYKKHVDPADYPKGEALKREVWASRNEYSWQYRIVTRNGEHKWLETYGYILRDKTGNVRYSFGITRDITRLKSYEHSLELKINELNRSNAELEEFAYVASHDMQEPLRKLITFSERLTAKYSGVLQDDGKMYINRMLAATNNMRMLIDNLLDFSRVARTSEAFAPTDLNDVLRNVLADLEVSIDETKAVVTAAQLPVIEAQAPQMKQLFSNILSNALKFRKPGVPPAISISCRLLDTAEAESLNLFNRQYYKIIIADNGIGFEQEYADRIFQIFQRLHGKAEYPGSGIGLAICKKIVEYHHGTISALGRLDEGATITIILPEKQ